jgi:hypothetical protein
LYNLNSILKYTNLKKYKYYTIKLKKLNIK